MMAVCPYFPGKMLLLSKKAQCAAEAAEEKFRQQSRPGVAAASGFAFVPHTCRMRKQHSTFGLSADTSTVRPRNTSHVRELLCGFGVTKKDPRSTIEFLDAQLPRGKRLPAAPV
jgi:hypothetical protein